MNDCRRCKACAGHGAGMLLLLACARAAATDVVVYDDALQSGWQDYSYGGGSNFASTAQAHGGSQSIAFTGGGGAGAYNAVSLYHPADYTTAAYPTLHFWVHGGSSGGQQLYLFLQDANGIVAQAPLGAYIAGGAIVAGTWKEVSVPLTGGALAYSGPYRRIDLQSDSNSAQPLLYLDDISLRAAATDAIFANGFEGTGPGVPTLVQEHDVNVLSMLSDRFTWRDSSNRPRVASLAHNDAGAGPGGTQGGELREFRYEAAGGTRVVRASGSGASGFGYVVSHPNSEAYCTPGHGDTSSLGHFRSGTWTRLFEGRHHAIFRFQSTYPRYCTTAPPAVAYDLPVAGLFTARLEARLFNALNTQTVLTVDNRKFLAGGVPNPAFEDPSKHDEMVGHLASGCEVMGTEALDQPDQELAAFVALAEQVVADVRVAGRVQIRECVEVEGCGVQLLYFAERPLGNQRSECREQLRSAFVVLGEQPPAILDRGPEFLVRVVEHVGEARQQRTVDLSHDAHQRRSGAVRGPKPASCLRVNGSVTGSIACSRASGGITKRSSNVGIDVSRKIASASSPSSLPSSSTWRTRSGLTSPTDFERM